MGAETLDPLFTTPMGSRCGTVETSGYGGLCSMRRRSEVSCFARCRPQGLRPTQRERNFETYQDLEARYEQRPSAWVTPKDAWGAGYVELRRDLEPGGNMTTILSPIGSRTRLCLPCRFRIASPTASLGAMTHRYGRAFASIRHASVKASKPGATRFVVDFVRAQSRADHDIKQVASNATVTADAWTVPLPDVVLTASAGALTKPVVQSNPHLAGIRVNFELDPRSQGQVELRLTLYAKRSTDVRGLALPLDGMISPPVLAPIG